LFGVYLGCGGVYKPSGLTVFTGSPRLGDESTALSLGGLVVDGSPVPLGSTATHDPTAATKALWARWKPLDETPEKPRNEGNDHLGTNGLQRMRGSWVTWSPDSPRSEAVKTRVKRGSTEAKTTHS